MKSMKAVVGVVLVLAAAQSAMAAVKVSEQEQSEWLRWVIPLPKKTRIDSKVELPASEVKITVRRGAGDTEKTAADQLTALFKEKGNTVGYQRAFDTGGSGEAFEILIGVCDAEGKVADVTLTDIADLENLPNRDQAYLIRPVGQDRLVLTALHERGVYYAVQTLRQLLENRFDKGAVAIPLISVTDWPDMARRGEWGCNICAPDETLWMAHHKMNLIQYEVRWKVGADGRGGISGFKQPAKYAPVNVQKQLSERSEKEMRAFGNRHAMYMDPSLMHYSLLGERTRIFDVYPELKEPIKSKGNYVPAIGEVNVRFMPCPSQPKMVDLLADFMRILAETGAAEIDCCLTEDAAQCGCKTCLAAGEDFEFALETRAYVNAWRRVVKQYPDLKIRISLSQGSYRTDNAKVLAEIPPGVGVSYYDGGRSYDSSRDPMIYPPLEAFAAKGGYLGVVPSLTASYAVVSPWTAPQFIRYRMNEFVDKKLQVLIGYPTPTNRLYDFNVTATAEWSWNAKGRSEREFAAAWATRRGLEDADAVADWAVMLGPVSWDVYGSGIPYPHFMHSKAGKLVANRGKPSLGDKRSMFRYFPTVEHMDNDLAVCDQAMAIARRIGAPEILHETRVIRGYVNIVKEIYTIAAQVSELATPTYADRVKLQAAMNRLTMARFETVDGLIRWERSIGLGLRGYERFSVNSIAWVDQTVDVIGESLASSYGVQPFTSPYFNRKIGEWATADFKDKQVIEKKWEVTQQMPPSGACEVTFMYLPRSQGAYMSRVALVSAPEKTPAKVTEVSIDRHAGYAGKRGISSTSNIYTVTLKKRDPALRYFILADIRTDEDDRVCNGAVWIKAPAPADWDPAREAANLRPLTDEELAEQMPELPKFTGKGLRVGVVYGKSSPASTSILACLRGVDNIDAQPLVNTTRAAIMECDVIVYLAVVFQPKGFSVGEQLVGLLEDFVKAGGGLISIHDAVGYRGQAELIKTVCARGVAHVRDARWTVVKQHPVTAGIEQGKTMFHSYYDHIELENGPQGAVLATGDKTGKPVVVAGAYGKGRYLACGMIVGVSQDDKPTPLTNGERILIQNAVKWCGRQSADPGNR